MSTNCYFCLSLLFSSAIAFNPLTIESTLATTHPELVSQQTQSSLIDRGRSAYQAGRYQEAKTQWQQADRQTNNSLSQAQILNYLALAEHKLGNWQQAEQHISQSLDLLTKNQNSTNVLNLKAQALNTQGRLELSRGQAKSALASWQQAAELYQQVGDDVGLLGIEINQAQAWQDLGLYRRAQKSLVAISQKLESQSEPSLQITGWRNLGIALKATGDLTSAEEAFNKSLAISQKLNLRAESSNTLFNLGNVALGREDRQKAIALYQQSAETATEPLLKTKALLNQLSVLIAEEQWQQATDLLATIDSNLGHVSNLASRRGVYLSVNLAKNLIQLAPHTSYPARQKIPSLLIVAIEQAQTLQDLQAESYALGMLGHYYETQQQPEPSLKYTQKAVQLAQTIDRADLTYQWQWQLGRLLKQAGKQQSAIASYTEAVNALENLRSDLVVTNTDLQFGFRQSIEPVYRELVSLLLTPENQQPIGQARLLQARNTIESLQLAELNNFFREACIDADPTAIDRLDSEAAVIYPIILRDRLEVIVSLPDKSLRHYSQAVSQKELETTIEELNQTLQIRSRRTFFSPAQQLYSWLIKPILSDLESSQIETLVFIPDGAWRNIPLATLHDGEKYLIENYNIALTPGLQLLAPLPLEQIELKTLAAGITQQRRGFSSLEYVDRELSMIQDFMDSSILQDDLFTKENLKEKIQTAEYPIVHIATHGQFSSNLEDTFLLAWDKNIDIQQLNELLESSDPHEQQKAIELLILSACETATGDDRAALGLAGMAVRAGARTTLATLWAVGDRSTSLAMNVFYEQITQPQTKRNKARALRQAQLELLNSSEFSHPYYWSPFVLLGNWL